MHEALKKRLLDAQTAVTHGSYVDRMAACAELGAATQAIFDLLDKESDRARAGSFAEEALRNEAAIQGRDGWR